jgi:predicted nuclease of predicted toxin-antitoxin system
MTVRLLASENVPRAALHALRAAGIEIESVSESMPSAHDADVLAHAAANGQWLVTFDRDYGELAFARKAATPPAIVYLRQGAYPPTWPAEAVLAALGRPDFVAGHLVVIRGLSMRRHVLPSPRKASPTTNLSPSPPCSTGPTARVSAA